MNHKIRKEIQDLKFGTIRVETLSKDLQDYITKTYEKGLLELIRNGGLKAPCRGYTRLLGCYKLNVKSFKSAINTKTVWAATLKNQISRG